MTKSEPIQKIIDPNFRKIETIFDISNYLNLNLAFKKSPLHSSISKVSFNLDLLHQKLILHN